MNEVIRQLYERKSVRTFTDRDIDEAIVREILTAAIMAPTAGNQQLYTILRITDPDIKQKLSESCDHQPFIAKGKLLLIFCADCLKWYEAFRMEDCQPRLPGPGDLLLAVDDALIAAQNAVVAAQSYGIGSCYIGDIMENIEWQREILQLPDYVFPAAMLVFGYPTLQQQERKKPERSPLEYIVQENTYRSYDRETLQKMLQIKTGHGKTEREDKAHFHEDQDKKKCGQSDQEAYRNWLQAFCRRKYNSDFAREMSRSVAEYLKQYDQ